MKKPDFSITVYHYFYPWGSPSRFTYPVTRQAAATTLWNLRKGGSKLPVRTASGVYALLLDTENKDLYLHKAALPRP